MNINIRFKKLFNELESGHVDIRDRVKPRKDESLVHLERLEAILYEWQKTQGSEPVAPGDEVGEEVVGNGLGG